MASRKPPAKKRGRPGPKPHDLQSKESKRFAKKTEGNLSVGAKLFRDAFITEYLIDHNATQAYVRAGGRAGSKKGQNNGGYMLTREPYVAKKIQEAIDAAEEAHLISRKRILAGLNREANYTGVGASHAARVSAYSKLATVIGMDPKHVQATVSMHAGVMIVPATEECEPWEKRAAAAQAALKQAVRE